MEQGETRPLNIVAVEVDGVPQDRADTIKAETTVLLSLFASSSEAAADAVRLTVVITDDMEAAVDRVRASYGIPSPRPYTRARVGGDSHGIAVRDPTSPQCESTLVLHNEFWTTDEPHKVVWRVHLLGYLLGHEIRWTTLANDEADRFDPDMASYPTALKHTASVLYDHFAALITATTLLDACLRDQNGEPVSAVDVIGPGMLASLQSSLEQLGVFAAIDVQLIYRAHSIGLEDLPWTAVSLVGTMLYAALGAASQYSAAGRIDEFNGFLDRMNGYSEYLEPAWGHVRQSVTDECRETGIEKLVSALEDIIERIGLRIEPQEQGGLYVHVHDPVLCTWEME